MHPLGHGIRDGVAHAAANHADALEAFHVGGTAQRPDKVRDAVSRLEEIEHTGRLPDGLHHDGHSALLGVRGGDGDGNTLAVLVQPEDDELAGSRLAGDQRSLDHEFYDGLRFVQRPLADNFEHIYPPNT